MIASKADALAEIGRLVQEIERLRAANKTVTEAFEESDQACANLEEELGALKLLASIAGVDAGMTNMRDYVGKPAETAEITIQDISIKPVIPTGLECPSCGDQIKIGGTHYCKNYCPTCGADRGEN